MRLLEFAFPQAYLARVNFVSPLCNFSGRTFGEFAVAASSLVDLCAVAVGNSIVTSCVFELCSYQEMKEDRIPAASEEDRNGGKYVDMARGSVCPIPMRCPRLGGKSSKFCYE